MAGRDEIPPNPPRVFETHLAADSGATAVRIESSPERHLEPLMHEAICPNLIHLDRMTDSTGLLQHCIYSVPRRDSGYTTDDNARALRLCARLWSEHPDERMRQRVVCYLSFLEHARCPVGGFHNFMSYRRAWLDVTGTGDSQGQAVLALAEVVAADLPRGITDLAREMIQDALPGLAGLTSLRAWSYVIQAWALLWRADIQGIDALETIARQAADRLVKRYYLAQQRAWPWFEPQLTYANAVLPHALFDAAERWPDAEFLTVAETTFRFLEAATCSHDVFWPVGNLGWYPHGDDKSLYDQQPVEAATMAAAALTALRLRDDQRYLDTFRKAHGWFNGRNSLSYPMADIESGGCFDGLVSTGVNRNQGAESTIALLWTQTLAMELPRARSPAPIGFAVNGRQFLAAP